MAEDLQTALANNTVIDTALGVVMAQNHCGHDTAFDVLVRAADSRNTKVRDVAAAVVASVSAARFRSRQERIRQIQHRWAQFRAK
nr:ANTAR domain-containing protein [Paenarthrobacter ureafaciens]